MSLVKMKKRILPIPLILLIPIVMLLIVIVAGLYRFSLSDEEILAKFPASTLNADPIVERLTSLKTPNPLTVMVPETKAFALISEYNPTLATATGRYDSGAERGQVSVLLSFWQSLEWQSVQGYTAPFAISNQGSGTFYYLGLFKFDPVPQRLVMVDAVLLGDRITIESLQENEQQQVNVIFLKHAQNQSFSQQPVERVFQHFVVENGALKSVK